MTEPIMENNKAEETRLDINVGAPSAEFIEKKYDEFVREYEIESIFTYHERRLKKVLKADLIKDLIRLHTNNYLIRKQSFYPHKLDSIAMIEEYQKRADEKIDKLEEEKRLLLFRVAELEEQLEKCNVRRCEL
jgi:hypothetical protein